MGGDLSKFKLVITAYDPAFGISDREMQRAIGLPLLTVIPHDALVAHQAVNEGLPFVLSDREGPLGSAIVELAGIYLPGMKQQRSGLRIGNLKRLFVREA
jgi:Flp pilus assembly CpaE family ATPase